MEPSVQIPKKSKKQSCIYDRLYGEDKKRAEIYNNFDNREEVGVVTMRDLYNRKEKLEYWIQRASTDLCGTDKVDVLKLIQFMQDKERADLWIVRCITALISLRKKLGKPFKDATKDDIRSILRWMDEEKHYKASTNEKFRQILKLFYKVE